MKLNQADHLGLDKPLIVFDLETTGLSVNDDRIIQLAYVLHRPGQGEAISEMRLFNPDYPISPEASKTHGYVNQDLLDQPLFKEQAQEIFDLFKDSYYGGFNVVGFDLPLLKREFMRAGLAFSYSPDRIIDGKVIYHYMEPRNLTTAYRLYCGKELVGAHDALVDVKATDEVIIAQLAKYGWEEVRRAHEEMCEDRADVEGKFYWKDGVLYFGFSKFKNQSLAAVAQTEPGFLQWILNADFSDEVKDLVKDALRGKTPTKQ